MTIHSPCFFHANDTDIIHIAWFLAAFPLFSFNGSSIAPTTVNRSNRRSRFNLDVIPPITHQVIPLQHNRIALVIAVFFLSYSPQQQSLPFIIICHVHLFRSTSWSFPLSNLASVDYQLAMKPNRIQYSLAVASLLYQPLTTTPTPPYSCPLGISTSTSITLSQPTATTFNCAVNFLLPQPTMCLDVSLPLVQPVYSVQPTSFQSHLHIYLFSFFFLSLSILVVVYREGLRGIPGPQTRNFLHFPQVKPKAYSNIYSFFYLVTSFCFVHYKRPCYSYLVSLAMVSVPLTCI